MKDYHSKYLKYKNKYLYEKENLIGGERGDKIILFAISSNPPTLSHINIVKQLSSQYSHVVVWTSTNPNKENIDHLDYDPHYLPAEKRIEMFRNCVKELQLQNVVFAQEYADLYSGVSICNYIDKNLTRIEDSSESINGVHFKQFTLKSESSRASYLEESKKYELWICFGKDVVADTPNWSYNNLFLTLATGILMIDRDDSNNYETDRYSLFNTSQKRLVSVGRNTYFTMPCIKGKESVTVESIVASINRNCYDKNISVVKDLDPPKGGPLCIVEKKTFLDLGDTSSSRVRNYMMLYHLTEKPEDKAKIEKKLKLMVPDIVLSMMISQYLYNIPNFDTKITADELNKRRKILEKLGLPTNQQIIARIVDKDFFS
jgi:nicotinic acid mononucleotide adenylyltransferase